jgi:hypothetical protein
MSCVDGSLIATIDLTLMPSGRVQSCVRPVAYFYSGVDSVRRSGEQNEGH